MEGFSTLGIPQVRSYVKNTDNTPYWRQVLDIVQLLIEVRFLNLFQLIYPILFVKSQFIAAIMPQCQVSKPSDVQIRKSYGTGSQVLTI